LIAGVGMAARGMPRASDTIERAARSFGELGAGVLEASALAYAAIAASREGTAETAGRLATEARTLAALLEVPLAAGVAALALGVLSQDERELGRARDVLEPAGGWDPHWLLTGQAIQLPSSEPEGTGVYSNGQVRDLGGEVAAVVELRCLGGFSLSIHGNPLDESAAKPMERALLHLLALRANEAVHREALIEALWPEADPDAGLHRLQVAVSSLRRLVTAAGGDGSASISREGDAYRLVLPEGSFNELDHFEQAVDRAARARSHGEVEAEKQALQDAIAAYRGPLLPGDGPAEWAVTARRRLQVAVTDSAARLGALMLQDDQPAAAADAARAGLAIDRYRDDLWKVLIEASERAGNHADAGQARRAYEAVLEELGV
jgi:DNA-binding SARP family transcriptional activator